MDQQWFILTRRVARISRVAVIGLPGSRRSRPSYGDRLRKLRPKFHSSVAMGLLSATTGHSALPLNYLYSGRSRSIPNVDPTVGSPGQVHLRSSAL